MRAYRPSQYPDLPDLERIEQEVVTRRGERIKAYAWRVAAGLPLFERDTVGALGEGPFAHQAVAF